MSERFKLPSELDLRGIFSVLFDGMDLKVIAEMKSDAGSYMGVYVDDTDSPVTACVCDIDFAAYSSSSLTMMPPRIAEESIQAGRLDDNLVANLGEVFNILSRLFMNNETDHLRFGKSYFSTEVPDECSRLFDDARRVSYEIDIPRYGAGTINFIVAA